MRYDVGDLMNDPTYGMQVLFVPLGLPEAQLPPPVGEPLEFSIPVTAPLRVNSAMLP